MTLRKLIRELVKFDLSLEVRLEDWQEGYSDPMVLESKGVTVQTQCGKTFLLLGNIPPDNQG